MIPWNARPVEIANLLNPFFCALLVHETVREYAASSNSAMPIGLTHLALPIALHKRTREQLPGNTRTRMHPWIENHPQVRVGFAQRVRALRGPVREGIIMAAQKELIHLDAGNLAPTRKGPAILPSSWDDQAEAYSCWRAAGFIGRWFRASATTTTIFALWGVKP